jgi:xanthine dehydrogenase iron-sulfur cluster and FAD-binding subunit A
MWNKYICASSIEDTLQILSQNPEKSRIIAGGTDLVLELEKGVYTQNEILVDVSRVSGLDSITQDNSGRVHIGPMVTHNQCVKSPVIQKFAPLLAEACLSVGSPQIRNRGTIAGNLITASPANDTISPLMALDTEVILRSLKGERKVKLNQFYTGVRKTVKQPYEMLVDISFQALSENQPSAFSKFALRKAQAISLVNTSIILNLENNVINTANITLGAVAPTIIHSKNAEEYLTGKKVNEIDLAIVAEKVKLDISPISDIRSSADYRKKIASIIVCRGLERIIHKDLSHSVIENPVVLWGQHTPNEIKLNKTTEINSDASIIQTKINGKDYSFKTGQQKSLLHLIREEGGLTGSKEGCAEGECGACTVFLDGVAVMSCLVPAPRANGAEIVTIEGITDGEKLHPVQEAFIKEGAVQCGYCTPGFVMSAVKLFEEKKAPDINDVKMSITGNLCRCTGYYKIIRAIESVAENQEG